MIGCAAAGDIERFIQLKSQMNWLHIPLQRDHPFHPRVTTYFVN